MIKTLNENETKEELLGIVVSPYTGEYIDEIRSGDKIKHKSDDKKKKEFLENYEPNFNKGESFVKLYDKTLSVLRKNLKPTEAIFAVSLAEYVSYQDGILRRGGHGNGKFLDMKDLSVEMDIDYNVVRRIMSVLISKGIVCKYEVGCVENPKLKAKGYVCNPWIFIRGNIANRTVMGLFENSGWRELLDKQNKRNHVAKNGNFTLIYAELCHFKMFYFKTE